MSMEPKFIDIHSHVQFAAYDEDRAAVVERALESGTWMINVGTQRDTSQNAITLAESYPEGVYATVGLHPIHTDKSYHDTKELGGEGSPPVGGFVSRGEQFDTANYEKLARHPKVVAIGECGLDYYRLSEESAAKQKEAFIQQIELANTVGKPLMLHIRNAYADAYEIVKAHANVPGDVHFFAGTWEEGKKFLDLGFTLSFTGVITFASQYDEVIQNAPLSMILSETDAPYITPTPNRGKRNEPLYVSRTVERIAEIKGLPFEEVRNTLAQNARRVFSL